MRSLFTLATLTVMVSLGLNQPGKSDELSAATSKNPITGFEVSYDGNVKRLLFKDGTELTDRDLQIEDVDKVHIVDVRSFPFQVVEIDESTSIAGRFDIVSLVDIPKEGILLSVRPGGFLSIEPGVLARCPIGKCGPSCNWPCRMIDNIGDTSSGNSARFPVLVEYIDAEGNFRLGVMTEFPTQKY